MAWNLLTPRQARQSGTAGGDSKISDGPYRANRRRQTGFQAAYRRDLGQRRQRAGVAERAELI
jgi:hypothetical protein